MVTKRPPKPTRSNQAYNLAHKTPLADKIEAMLDMLYGPNPITDEELGALIRKYPERYKMFEGFIGKRVMPVR